MGVIARHDGWNLPIEIGAGERSRWASAGADARLACAGRRPSAEAQL